MPGPVVETILARLTASPPDHERFRGAPIDIAGLTGRELGRLWPHLQRAGSGGAAALAHEILAQAVRLELVPVLGPEELRESLRDVEARDWPAAIRCLGYAAGEALDGASIELRRILGDPSGWAEQPGAGASEQVSGREPAWEVPYAAYAIACLVDAAARAQVLDAVRAHRPECPYLAMELEGLESAGHGARLALAGAECDRYWPGHHTDEPDPAVRVSDDPACAELARALLECAVRRLEDIQRGAVRYVADGAFSAEDAQVLARAARVAALRDEPWLRPLIGGLLGQACVAPTSAATMPSQALTIALGHAIQRAPTPEGVEALRQALSSVRHAGVKKKLARNLKPAERGLAGRPGAALRLAGTAIPREQRQTMLATLLEAGFSDGLTFGVPEWRDALVRSAAGAVLGRGLVWVVDGPVRTSFILGEGEGPEARDADGNPVHVPEAGRVQLWHPLLAEEPEREAWRALVRARRLRQPVRQVFREHYRPLPGESASGQTALFVGHVVSIGGFLGLARREGWRIQAEGFLERRFGEVLVTCGVNARLYPGLGGSAEVLPVQFSVRDGQRWRPAMVGQLPPVLFSEACRAVDLLVSTTAFALEGSGPADGATDRRRFLEKLELGEMARMRRDALRHAFAAEISSGAVVLDARHARVGDHTIHLATARVTRDGTPVELDPRRAASTLRAVPWLPYDEALLERIAGRIAALLER